MNRKCFLAVLSASTLLGAGCTSSVPYPESVREDTKDTYFGTEVADPYRWLENDTTQRVAAWVQAQNALTYSYLEKIPFRDKLRGRISELFNFDTEVCRSIRGSITSFTRRRDLRIRAFSTSKIL